MNQKNINESETNDINTSSDSQTQVQVETGTGAEIETEIDVETALQAFDSDIIRSLELEENYDDFSLNSPRELNLAIADISSKASRHLDILSYELDRKVFDQENIRTALFDLARRGREVKIRILLESSENAVRYGHQLVQLAQRLSSYFEVRILSDEFKNQKDAFVIADRIAIVHQPIATQYRGVLAYNRGKQIIELLNDYDNMWAHASPDPNFRKLYI